MYFINNIDNGLRSSEANRVEAELLEEEPIKKNSDRHANVLKVKKSARNMRKDEND
jgi:hypothetical protein